MAQDESWEFLPTGWPTYEKEMWTDAFEPLAAFEDRTAQTLFNEGYFNFELPSEQISAIRDALDSYLLQEYGVDFDEIFDWEAYREAYGEAQ